MGTNWVCNYKLWVILGLLWAFGLELIQCGVTYDRKSLVIDGQRRILFSGSIHYPRSTPEVCISGLLPRLRNV